MAGNNFYREIKHLWAGPRRGAILAAAGVLAVLLLGWQQAGLWYRARLLADQHDRIDSALIPYGNSLSTILNQHFAQLNGLAAFALANPTRAELAENFEPFAAGLYSGKKSLRAIQIFPPTGTIFVYPVAGNEATLNRTLADLINDERPDVRADVQRAIQTRRIALSGPYELRQGGFGLVARQAVYQDNTLWGMAVVVIDLPPVFRDAGLETLPPDIDAALRDAAGQTILGNDTVFAAQPALYPLELPEGRWELAALPAGGWLPAIQTPRLIFEGVGLVLVGLLTGLVYLAVNRQSRLVQAVQSRTVALAESEERYRQLFDNNADALFLVDNRGHIVDVNEVACQRYGYSRAELLQMPVHKLVVPDLRHKVPARVQSALAGSTRFEWRHCHKDGRELPVEVNTGPLQLNNQTYILSSVRDISARVETARALRQSEERFRVIFEQAAVGMAQIDSSTGEFARINRKYCEILGYSLAEMTQSVFWQITHPDDRAETLYQLDRLLNDEIRMFSVEKRYFHRDGAIVWVNLTVSPMWPPGAPPDYHIAVVEDITQRKQAQLALREKDMLLQETSRLAKIGGWEFDVGTLQGTWTEEVARIYGLDPNDETNVEIGLSFYHGESRPKIEAAVQNAINLGQPYDLELELVTAAGTHKWVRTIGQPVKEDNRVVKVRGMFQDITERKWAEDALRESEEKYRTLIEQASDGIFLVGPEGRYIEVNASGCRMLGYSREEILQLNPVDLVPPEDREPDPALLEKMLAGETVIAENRLVRKDGAILPVETSAKIFTDGRIQGIVRDITERKRAEEALRINQERLEMAQAVGHVGSWEYDLATGFVWGSPEGFRIYGLEPLPTGEIPIDQVEARIPERERVHQALVDLITQGKPYNLEYAINPVGHETPRIITSVAELVRDEAGKPVRVVGVIQDVSARKQAEEALRQLNADLEQRVAQRTAELEQVYRRQAAEEERQRLARDLHDAVSQSLFSASIIAEALPRLWARKPEMVAQNLVELHRLTRGALAEMRTLLLELRPDALKEVPLPDLLRQLTDALTGRTQAAISLTIDVDCTLPGQVKNALYRIAQEALNNVTKHARPKTVIISLQACGDSAAGPAGVRLTIEDDGRGFDPAREMPGHLGLDIMQERAAAINARLTLTSAPGQGTTVEVIWP